MERSMTPESKSSRGPRARTYKRSEDERRAAALARVKLYTVDGTWWRLGRGLLAQLVDAGLVPGGIAADEADRRPIEWCDLDRRVCVLRPYGRLQWEAKVFRLRHEADEMRLIEGDQFRAFEEDRKRAAEAERERDELAQRLRLCPPSLDDYRAKLARQVESSADLIEAAASGEQYEGARIDEESLSEIRAAFDSIRATLAAATYRCDPTARTRLQVQLHSLDAKRDDQLQALLRQAGAKS
jgi:hypothetical protein